MPEDNTSMEQAQEESKKEKKPKQKKNLSSITIGGGPKYPSKTSINLMIVESHTKSHIATMLATLVIAVGLLVFAKYMILDKIDEVNRMGQYYYQQSGMLATLKRNNEKFNEVQAEFGRYGTNFLNESEIAEQDRMEILKVIEEELLDKDALQTISITENVAKVTINSSKLKNVSQVVFNLENRDNVEYVTVSTSTSEEPEYLEYALAYEPEALEEEVQETQAAGDVRPFTPGVDPEPMFFVELGLTPEEAGMVPYVPEPAEEEMVEEADIEEGVEEEEEDQEQLLGTDPYGRLVTTTLTIYFRTAPQLEAIRAEKAAEEEEKRNASEEDGEEDENAGNTEEKTENTAESGGSADQDASVTPGESTGTDTQAESGAAAQS